MTGPRVLARRPLTVEPAVVTLEAASSAAAGSAVEVIWTGPSGPGDLIAIVPVGFADGGWPASANRVKAVNSPLSVTAPTSPGAYEIVYQTGQDRIVLKRRPLTVRSN